MDGNGRVILSGDGWFERYRPSVRPSTFDRRRYAITQMVDLLDLRIDRITPATVEDMTLKLQAEHPRQAKFIHETITMILRAAKVRGQRVNPDVFDVRPPSYHPERRRQGLSVAQVGALAEASDEQHLIRVAAYTGLRQGELFALRDSDVDLEGGTITATGTAHNGQREDRTKTLSSTRVVPLTPSVVRELRRQLMRRKGTDWIFPAPKGGMWHRSEFSVKFKEWAKNAGLDITFHDLRHTFASLMVESGVHPKVLQELMGHKTFAVTMGIYTHLQDQQRVSAMDGLEKLIEHVG